jgi:hypothetical protein
MTDQPVDDLVALAQSLKSRQIADFVGHLLVGALPIAGHDEVETISWQFSATTCSGLGVLPLRSTSHTGSWTGRLWKPLSFVRRAESLQIGLILWESTHNMY